MRTVKLDASEIEYFVDGEGPPLILIHGTGANADTNWSLMLPTLAANHRVIRPNYSGSGNTSDDGSPLTIPQLAHQILACADACNVEQFNVLGYSLGAAVATYIAGEFPQRAQRLILLAGFSASNDPRNRLQFDLWKRLIAQDRTAAAQLIMLTGFSPGFLSKTPLNDILENVQFMVEGNNWEGMQRQVDLDLSLDVVEQARKVRCPTLSIGCSHDHMVAASHARELRDIIVGAEYMELECGHLAPLEVPDQVTSAVLSFLSRHPPQ